MSLPRLAEWTPEREAITRVADLLGGMLASYHSAHGGRLSIQPSARPETAFERIRGARRQDRHLALVQRLVAPEQ